MIFLLDTNVCIAMFRGDPKVTRALDSHHPDSIYICSPTIAELYVGAYQSAQRRANVLLIEELLRTYDCLHFSVRESLKFADLVFSMALKGMTGTFFDMQIASIALAHGMTLVSSDGDFSRIPELSVKDWTV